MKKLRNLKFIKNVRARTPWIGHIINDVNTARDLNTYSDDIEVQSRDGSLCLSCRGSRMLCGKPRCPALLKMFSFIRARRKVGGEHVFGSSPPGIFVGRIGYPHVYAGPLVPPMLGDTSLFNTPERWIGRTVDEIVNFRTNLIRGKFRINVKKPLKNKHFLDKTLDIALSREPVDTEIHFLKKPSGKVILDETIQPMGPSALVKKMSVGVCKTDYRIEKVFTDSDFKAEDAVLDLYLNRVLVSKIQRTLSLGALGLKKQRRLVPTRWSITAVDSMISRKLIEDYVKRKRIINEYHVYEFHYMGNRYVVLLTPSSWRYEWIEAWFPGTTWNPQGRFIAMGNDSEGYGGRSTYASIGGCYYAVRMAVAEFLASEKKQAGVIAMREIHPNFITPLGVWINRECVREALKRDCVKFNTFDEALTYLSSRFSIRLSEWIKTSSLIRDDLYQEKLTKYL